MKLSNNTIGGCVSLSFETGKLSEHKQAAKYACYKFNKSTVIDFYLTPSFDNTINDGTIDDTFGTGESNIVGNPKRATMPNDISIFNVYHIKNNARKTVGYALINKATELTVQILKGLFIYMYVDNPCNWVEIGATLTVYLDGKRFQTIHTKHGVWRG